MQHTTRFDDEMFDRIRGVAIRDGVNLSEAIRTLCEWGLEVDAGDDRVTDARAEMTETCSRAVGMALKDAPQQSPVAAQIGRAAGAVIGAFMDYTEGKSRRAKVKEECCALIGLTLRLLHKGDETIARRL